MNDISNSEFKFTDGFKMKTKAVFKDSGGQSR